METYLEMSFVLFEVFKIYLPHEALVFTLIGQIKSKDNDGDKLLWRFLRLYVPVINPVFANNAPTFHENQDMQEFSWAFEQYYRLVRISSTITSEVVMSTSFLVPIKDVCYTPQRIILQQLEPYSNISNPLAEFGDILDNWSISGLAEAIQNGMLDMKYDPTNTTVSDLIRRINHIESFQQYSSPPYSTTLAGLSSQTFGPSVSKDTMMILKRFM